MKAIFKQSRMNASNRKLNRSLDLTNSTLFEIDCSNDQTQIDQDEDDTYLKTERDSFEEPDYRKQQKYLAETETPAD